MTQNFRNSHIHMHQRLPIITLIHYLRLSSLQYKLCSTHRHFRYLLMRFVKT